MPTVVVSKAIVGTVCEGGLLADTLHIIQPYRAAASTKMGAGGSRNRMAAAKLSAHHVSIGQLPLIITDGTPLAFIQDLHPPRTMTCTPNHP